MSETFYCPEGAGPDSPFKPPFNGEATWQTMPDGTRTCSYCGSLHPDDFLDIMTHYGAGDEGYRFDVTTKGYKAYGNRPGVENASQGGIKFYGWHGPAEGTPEREAHKTAWAKAVSRLRDQIG